MVSLISLWLGGLRHLDGRSRDAMQMLLVADTPDERKLEFAVLGLGS